MNGDPARLQQIVWNLLVNAVKFTPRGGIVDVALRTDSTHTQIHVTDTGEGIAPDVLPHIFDGFRPGDGSASRPHGGLGIGLRLAKELVRLHDGRVWASSDGKDHGATFVVALPLASTVLPAFLDVPTGGGEATGGLRQLLGVKVLLVEDSDDARMMLNRFLSDQGATVHAAPSASDALDRLRLDSFHVIISDIAMPGEDGYEFIARVRQAGFETPAIALTALAHSEDRERALAAGYHAHIAKPVNLADLLALVSHLFGVQDAAEI